MKQHNIYRGIDNDIEFKGLRGKYFYYAIGAAVGIIFLTFLLYLIGLPTLFALAFLAIGLIATYIASYRYNTIYGKWGADKLPVTSMQPKYIVRRDSYNQLIQNVTKDGKIKKL
ncbi:protein of unknown function [Dyadobacter sp. SG02]|uniref:DUF4133 domain-containing protein n=1 Tax=Dyadobacter sp. SG02 TaxID=1855291 RepID=UPI0008C7CD17|nr:DUF4133 domain-containing protein [Dyadobacter sp. SG02]SEJ74553.1 protein of unknown function [Dyadobacter sp. SG02]